jgi:serine-threonine kinase receptor-associated protein
MASTDESKAAQGPVVCTGHSRPVTTARYSPATAHGYFLATSGHDGVPMLRDGATGDWIGSFSGHRGTVWCSRFSKWGVHIITASADRTARVWDVAMGTEMLAIPHAGIVRGCAFTHDGYRVVTTDGAGVRLTDLKAEATAAAATKAPRAAPAAPAGPALGWVVPTNDPNVVASAALPGDAEAADAAATAGAGQVLLWDLRTAAPVRALATAGPVVALAADAAERIVTISTADSVTVLADIPTSSVAPAAAAAAAAKSARAGPAASALSACELLTVAVRSARGPVAAAAYSVADGADAGAGRVAVAVGDAVLGFDARTGALLFENCGHSGRVLSVDFAPAGGAVASASEDGNVFIWDWQESVAAAGRAAALASPPPVTL